MDNFDYMQFEVNIYTDSDKMQEFFEKVIKSLPVFDEEYERIKSFPYVVPTFGISVDRIALIVDIDYPEKDICKVEIQPVKIPILNDTPSFNALLKSK